MAQEVGPELCAVKGRVVQTVRRGVDPDEVPSLVEVVLERLLLDRVQDRIRDSVGDHQEQDQIVYRQAVIVEDGGVLAVDESDVVDGACFHEGGYCRWYRVC